MTALCVSSVVYVSIFVCPCLSSLHTQGHALWQSAHRFFSLCVCVVSDLWICTKQCTALVCICAAGGQHSVFSFPSSYMGGCTCCDSSQSVVYSAALEIWSQPRGWRDSSAGKTLRKGQRKKDWKISEEDFKGWFVFVTQAECELWSKREDTNKIMTRKSQNLCITIRKVEWKHFFLYHIIHAGGWPQCCWRKLKKITKRKLKSQWWKPKSQCVRDIVAVSDPVTLLWSQCCEDQRFF